MGGCFSGRHRRRQRVFSIESAADQKIADALGKAGLNAPEINAFYDCFCQTDRDGDKKVDASDFSRYFQLEQSSFTDQVCASQLILVVIDSFSASCN